MHFWSSIRPCGLFGPVGFFNEGHFGPMGFSSHNPRGTGPNHEKWANLTGLVEISYCIAKRPF